MPFISNDNQRVFASLNEAYVKLALYLKWMLRDELKTALDEYNIKDPTTIHAWAICRAFLTNPLIFQQPGILFLDAFSCTPLVRSLLKFYNTKMNLLTGDMAQVHFDVVVGHQNPDAIVDALLILDDAGLLTGVGAQEIRLALAESVEPSVVAHDFIRRNAIKQPTFSNPNVHFQPAAATVSAKTDTAEVVYVGTVFSSLF